MNLSWLNFPHLDRELVSPGQYYQCFRFLHSLLKNSTLPSCYPSMDCLTLTSSCCVKSAAMIWWAFGDFSSKSFLLMLTHSSNVSTSAETFVYTATFTNCIIGFSCSPAAIGPFSLVLHFPCEQRGLITQSLVSSHFCLALLG